MQYIITGLGNPGEEYDNTRHNVGRIILSHFIKNSKGDFTPFETDKKARALVAKGTVEKKKILLLEPDNFMNNSGASVKPFVKLAKDAEGLVVIHDDLDLPLGSYKLSFNRGSGGHRGIDSIIKNIKTQAFLRVRVGVSATTPSGKLKKPKGEEAVIKFIIGKFKTPELEVIKKLSKDVSDALVTVITEGRDVAMCRFNK